MNPNSAKTSRLGNYDGSKSPRVSPQRVETLETYNRGMERLQKRFEFLKEEYETCQAQFEESNDFEEKSKMVTHKSEIEAEVDSLKQLKADLEDRRSAIEEAGRSRVENAEFHTLEF